MLCVIVGFLVLTKYLSLEDTQEILEASDRVSKQCDPSFEEAGSSSRLTGNQGENEGQTENSKARTKPSEGNKANKSQIPKVWHGREAGALWDSIAGWEARALWDSIAGWEADFHPGVHSS